MLNSVFWKINMYLVLCCFMGTHISPRCLSFFNLLSKIKYKWIRPSSVIDLPPDEGVGYPPSLLLPTLWKWVSLAHLSTLSHKPSLNDVSDLISSQASAPTCFAGWAGFGVFVCFFFNGMWLSPHALCIQSLNIHLTRGKLHWENSVPVSALLKIRTPSRLLSGRSLTVVDVLVSVFRGECKICLEFICSTFYLLSMLVKHFFFCPNLQKCYVATVEKWGNSEVEKLANWILHKKEKQFSIILSLRE